jgi:hypothetical protein
VCVDNIDKNFADIYNLVRDNTDAGVICRVIKVCQDEHMIDQEQEKQQVSIKLINKEDTVFRGPFNSHRKNKLLGSKTEKLVVQVIRFLKNCIKLSKS